MKRFIRYLYEYEANQKKRNAGFVKVEQQAEEVTISIHGKDLCEKRNENISCYLMKKEEKTGNVILVPIGEIRAGIASCGGNFCYKEENPGCVCGIGLGNLADSFYIALWNEEDYENLNVTKMAVENQEDVRKNDADESGENEEKLKCADVNNSGEEKEDTDVSEPEEEPEESDVSESKEGSEESDVSKLEEKSDESDISDAEKKEDERIENPTRRIMKIQRGEISILPRCEWKLANNNFLLHGYYNYHHLVLIDEGERLKLGVPGIYHEREAKAARTFGFPEFIAEEDVKISLESAERNEEQPFGYWCRQVRRPPR